eukprot:9490830-Heterocapsa_arctica.AAC.1
MQRQVVMPICHQQTRQYCTVASCHLRLVLVDQLPPRQHAVAVWNQPNQGESFAMAELHQQV